MSEHEHEAARAELLARLTGDLRKKMDQVYGDRLVSPEGRANNDILPGIPNNAIDVETATNIRQLLALLHNDGFWNDERDQRVMTEQEIARSGIAFGASEPEQGTELLFSGNDKYGLVFGLRDFATEHISPEQLSQDGDRMYLGWYVELFNRYIESRPQEMYAIARQVAKAGLPLEPWVQAWMRRMERKDG